MTAHDSEDADDDHDQDQEAAGFESMAPEKVLEMNRPAEEL